MRYTHIVFDIDGTLMDSTPAIHEGLERTSEDLRGRRLTPAEAQACLGLPAKEALESIGLPGDVVTVRRWLAHMAECWDGVSVFDGIVPLLDALSARGLVLGAVTSESTEEMGQGFARFGLLDRFGCVITTDDTDTHKPGPAPLLEYLDRSGADAAETLYVGDAASDAACARAAGVDFVQACWKPRPERSPLAAKAFCTTPDQVLEFCEREEPTSERTPWLAWARELQAISQAGLYYTKDRFDRERFERIGEMACECMTRLSGEPLERVRGVFANEDGYQTPKLDSRAVIFDGQGRVCLVHEILGDAWSLPGGWVDQGQTIYSNVVKEAREEAGLEVVPERLVALEEHNLHNPHPFAWGIVKAFVICGNLGGAFVPNSETDDRRFFAADELPELFLSKNTPEQMAMCFAAHEAGGAWQIIVD